jgi:uncharacterized protein YggE
MDTISIHVKGSVETEFVSATFKAGVTTQGDTGPEAKEKAVPIREQILKVVQAHAEKARIDTTHLETTFGVDVDTHRTTGEFIGYKALYTITFTAKNVVEAPALHDALTSIAGVRSPTPVYNLNDAADVQARAFADAVAKGRVKFEAQCAALDLGPKNYRLASWTIREEEPRGKVLSFREGPTARAIGLEPGKATLDVHVTLHYEP